MPVVDPIADMLTRIRNAHGAYHKSVSIPGSKIKTAIAGILKDEGYITDFTSEDNEINVTLKYVDGKALISGMKKISTPGRRVFVGVEDIPSVLNGLGICILSTSKGVVDGVKAKELNVGGELLCEIW
ncbi:30S ribosomal protein S8 [Maridesulfovibrio salexigens]|uniref:Small ribosomal subunit protein uS8 n=1 Tax=Maridesulfovibrio salexigens (strain ATCC 14822 / DSM 2638 / NCIMB 8403 / VKM B-1763) TaxID=526222 RepID=C6C199_MARSD|nr:30S ribosomal protein S8 [Maridesulfovibrio salexigens]ACS79262.1 ribosomal protein S8 [Maridesulfovibrio salexigens DSM 2638]